VPTGSLDDLANGETMFLIGGCSSCHAVPKQEDSTRLGSGLGLVSISPRDNSGDPGNRKYTVMSGTCMAEGPGRAAAAVIVSWLIQFIALPRSVALLNRTSRQNQHAYE
jgi:hypothetical protein